MHQHQPKPSKTVKRLRDSSLVLGITTVLTLISMEVFGRFGVPLASKKRNSSRGRILVCTDRRMHMDMETFSDQVTPRRPTVPHFAGPAVLLLLVFLTGCLHRPRTEPPPAPPSLGCSVVPTEAMAGEPIMATVAISNFDPHHVLTYSWTSSAGQITARDHTATIDTALLSSGSYVVTAQVSDPQASGHPSATCSAHFSVKAAPRNAPMMSLSANPANVGRGEAVTVVATCNSPDDVPVTVGNWTATSGTILGTGNTATLNTTGVSPGAITINAACSDARGLNVSASTEVSVEVPPPPPPPPAILDTGREFLLSGDLEKAGYGMYSYLLWWNMPV